MKDDFDGLLGRISHMIDEVPDLIERALFEEATMIFNKSQELCPIDTKRLRDSGRISIDRTSEGFSAAITYSTDYAIYVHEDLTKYHNPPTQAKFLEQPARERLPRMLSNIEKRVKRMLEK